ncbi:MAG TPA: hypothetical protein VLK35_19950 [Methylomirabilota bacterium]|nr:hypothetical protein [Methylomirabilota bacterium]
MHTVLMTLLALLIVASGVAQAQVQVHVDIGFRLPAPPRLVVVPQVPAVRYVAAPAAPGNLFFYSGQYWVFSAGGWHVSGSYNGPWVVVAPDFVPRAVLLVPVEYYHVPPGHWKKWAKHRPPHWQEDWGHEWADKREWKSRDRDDDDDRHDRRGKGKGKGKGKGHGRDR